MNVLIKIDFKPSIVWVKREREWIKEKEEKTKTSHTITMKTCCFIIFVSNRFPCPVSLDATDTTEGWNRWTEHSIFFFRNFRISPHPTHAHHPATTYSTAHHFADTNTHTTTRGHFGFFFLLLFVFTQNSAERRRTNGEASTVRTPFSSVSSFDEWSVKKIVHITNWVLHPFEGKTFIWNEFHSAEEKRNQK